MSRSCREVNLRFKLDLRLLVLREDEEVVDEVTGEFSRSTTKKKNFTDVRFVSNETSNSIIN